MDRTLSAVLVVLVVVSAAFLVVISLTAYIGITYRGTLSSTYEYRVSIAPDAAIGNVTLYLPIPSRGAGNSAILGEIGAGNLRGLPPGWNMSLIGTEKFTMLEITAREIAPAPVGEPYLLTVRARVPGPIETRNAGSADLVLAPTAAGRPSTCGDTGPQVSPEVHCEAYEAPVYADYTAGSPVRLSIFLFLDGKNGWDVFGPSSNEYQDGLQVTWSGGARGWQPGKGLLVTGIGDYGLDFWVQGPGGVTPHPGGSRLPARWTPGPGGEIA
ncbi:MAG TPA: hypothetical protein VMS81_02040 [Methanomicrobiales archaeon]|jgi:hypothetical protein|nr:hypothetical protein [Methanomicrobiales archaeon]